ncbi:MULTISPECIES: TraR/DksA C4-type zinc finger protein [Shewanella]|uniref:TraR/DksA family transcriptional regulator n=1 Tax=Shewanella algae TaxID=38313 RepID=A0A7T8EGC7_9GAMM|nr:MULTISPECIES: TraR/DksA C4-type zinc finger protein [Shewanella]MBO2589342.1 TraR/DksA C4-type zinc finger protein [Shewanella algae]MBO2698127.1 TraR/DksA C4-type zinc finger protein [Shewanella algae]QQO85907.1 TraR/DksA family transcriptional regulator [Shewanella algae]BCV65101.1 Mu phage Mom translational regulator Com [Shewanella carassii]
MTELVDQAQDAEQKFREQAIARQLSRDVETPDIDEDGNRWCLDCGDQIAAERLAVNNSAVRCVPCQAAREPR